MFMLCAAPAIAQSNDTTNATTSDTATQINQAKQELLNADKFQYNNNPAGTGDIQVGKDALTWYLSRKRAPQILLAGWFGVSETIWFGDYL